MIKIIKSSIFWYRLARVALYSLVPLFIVYAVFIDINPSGKRGMRYDVGNPSPLISQFFPAHRLAHIAHNKQVLRDEPVYVTVRYPHRYDTATVQIDVDNPSGIAWKIGLSYEGSTDWNYRLQDPDQSGRASFSLEGAAVVNGRVRFMVAIPGGMNTNIFALRSFAINFERDSLIDTVFRRITLR